jgi:hypothetical protein
MVNQKSTPQEEVVGQVINVHFPLRDKPLDVQITVHINNVLNCYGKTLIKDFKEKLYNPEIESNRLVNRIIDHYGIENIKQWFSLIYGWEFTEKAG